MLLGPCRRAGRSVPHLRLKGLTPTSPVTTAPKPAPNRGAPFPDEAVWTSRGLRAQGQPRGHTEEQGFPASVPPANPSFPQRVQGGLTLRALLRVGQSPAGGRGGGSEGQSLRPGSPGQPREWGSHRMHLPGVGKLAAGGGGGRTAEASPRNRNSERARAPTARLPSVGCLPAPLPLSHVTAKKRVPESPGPAPAAPAGFGPSKIPQCQGHGQQKTGPPPRRAHPDTAAAGSRAWVEGSGPVTAVWGRWVRQGSFRGRFPPSASLGPGHSLRRRRENRAFCVGSPEHRAWRAPHVQKVGLPARPGLLSALLFNSHR